MASRRHAIAACIAAQGWQRDGSPFDEVPECSDVSGCTRAGRWEHPARTGAYCAQHVHAAICTE